MSFDFINFFALSLLLSTASLQASSYCTVESFEEKVSNKKVFKEGDISPFITQSCQAEDFVRDIERLQETSLQKMNSVLKDKGFQQLVTELTAKEGKNSLGEQRIHGSDSLNSTFFYVFVSFSLGECALLNLAIDAKKWGATLVLRGFKEGSYQKTAQSLQKIIQKTGQGFIIDPELFTLFAIQAVPTFVLSKPFQLNASERIQTVPPVQAGGKLLGVRPGGPLHDRIQGHVSAQYALETFAKEGDLKDEAKSLLRIGGAK